MTVVYYESDARLEALQDNAVGVIGYNGLARAFALNLRDSGLRVTIGANEAERAYAQTDSFNCDSIPMVTQQAEVILLLIPDQLMADIYIREISPNLHRGNALIFASSYNIAYGFIEPPPFVDVGLVAPRTSGGDMRDQFVHKMGFPSFVAVWQDASRQAWDRVLAVAGACGALRAGAIELNIEQEAELNLFVQQAVLPPLVHILTMASQLLLAQGYPAEAVLTDLYLSGKFNAAIQQIAKQGLLETVEKRPLTDQYSILSRLERFVDLKLERLMEITLEEIRNGQFVREWSQEYTDGQPRLSKLLRRFQNNELWEMEQQTLDLIGAEYDDDLPAHDNE
jgi:ketol-acid reductoisomerase